MQIKKTYNEINPELLLDELKDFVLKQGAVLAETKSETYSLPTDSSSFITRGTITFKTPGEPAKECLRAHIVGTAKGETKLMLDVEESLLPKEKISALLADLDFIFGTFEIKSQ